MLLVVVALGGCVDAIAENLLINTAADAGLGAAQAAYDEAKAPEPYVSKFEGAFCQNSHGVLSAHKACPYGYWEISADRYMEIRANETAD